MTSTCPYGISDPASGTSGAPLPNRFRFRFRFRRRSAPVGGPSYRESARRAAPAGHTTSTGIPASRAASTRSAVPPPRPLGGSPFHTATSRSARARSRALAASYACRSALSRGSTTTSSAAAARRSKRGRRRARPCCGGSPATGRRRPGDRRRPVRLRRTASRPPWRCRRSRPASFPGPSPGTGPAVRPGRRGPRGRSPPSGPCARSPRGPSRSPLCRWPGGRPRILSRPVAHRVTRAKKPVT